MDLENKYFILPDLDKKIDEAIHDAINFFDKKCPYCEALLFTGHIRNKIQIDHFIPISKGGQHVPWNILPVCQNCNSKKSAKKPKLFLSERVNENCIAYLNSIRSKYVGQIQIDLEKFSQIKAIFNNFNSINKSKSDLLDTIKTIYQIVYDRKVDNLETFETLPYEPNYNLELIIKKYYRIPDKEDIIRKYSATEITNNLQQHLKFRIQRNTLSKMMKKMGFYHRLERLNSVETKRVFYVALNSAE